VAKSHPKGEGGHHLTQNFKQMEVADKKNVLKLMQMQKKCFNSSGSKKESDMKVQLMTLSSHLQSLLGKSAKFKNGKLEFMFSSRTPDKDELVKAEKPRQAKTMSQKVV